MSRVLRKDEILLKARNSGGFFTVNRNSYNADKLRAKLKRMSKDKNCPLSFYAKTQNELIFNV